jgi:hypothetical protein
MATTSVPTAYVRLTVGRIIIGLILAVVAFVIMDQLQPFQLGEPLFEVFGIGPDGGWVARWLAFCVFLVPTIVGAIIDGYSFSKGASGIVQNVSSVAKAVEPAAASPPIPTAGVSQTEFADALARIEALEKFVKPAGTA